MFLFDVGLCVFQSLGFGVDSIEALALRGFLPCERAKLKLNVCITSRETLQRFSRSGFRLQEAFSGLSPREISKDLAWKYNKT